MQKNAKFFLLFITLLLSACATDISPNTYDDATFGEARRVMKGVIVDMRKVNVKGNSGVGAIAGGAAGAVAGSTIGGGRGSSLAGIAGAVAGGVAGQAIDKKVNTQVGVEYIIQLDEGKTMSVVQGDTDLRVGDRVLLIYGKQSRIVADRSGN